MGAATRGFMHSIRTPVGAGELWHWLLDPGHLQRWLATDATVESRLGGRYAVRSVLFGEREAHIERLQPGLRLTLVYHASPGWPLPVDGALVEDFLLDERGGQHALRVLGSGVPAGPDWAALHRRLQAGWMVAFSRLQRVLVAEQR